MIWLKNLIYHLLENFDVKKYDMKNFDVKNASLRKAFLNICSMLL